MEALDYIKFVSALALVLGLMGGLAIVVKKVGLGNVGLMPADKRRLKVVEVLPLDARRRLLLIRRDNNTDHLVILGASGETVIETNIPVDQSKDAKQDV